MSIIHTSDLHVVIEKKPILTDIHANIEKGDFIGLIGPNGSGKSTLLRTLAGLQKITKGSIKIAGKELNSYRTKKRATLMSYVPQETKVDFHLKAREIVLMGRHVHTSRFVMETKEDIRCANLALQETNSLHLAEQSILNLSGGQRQLIFLAKALAQETSIILLDEPISALDIHFQLHILELLQRRKNQGVTIIAVLHDLNLAARYCNKLMLIKDGQIMQFGNPEHVLTNKLLKHAYHVNTHIRFDDATESVTVTAFR